MIDEITLHIDGKNIDIDLSKLQHIIQTDTHTKYAAYKNMRIKQNLNGITIHGSLAKLHYGENMNNLNRDTVKQAIGTLENDLCINLQTAIVKRIATAASIITKDKPHEYLKLFNYKPNTKRTDTYSRGSVNLETVSFGTDKGSYQFCAYDKTAEMIEHRQPIPALFAGSNVLRLENRIMRRRGIKDVFKKDLTAYDLFDYDTYRKLQLFLLASYKKIEKTGRTVFIDTSKNITPANIEALQAEAFRQSHPMEYADTLQRAKEAGSITIKNLERIRASNRKNAKNYTTSDKSPLIAELDAKLENHCKCGS
ncbi:MAG: hypothetical protein Ta2B_08250 [Termitinemataceae bacterium]|nr:MAG: hypothetical protein Ta2B_08250 [Termitinemataceae bacterium]